MTMMMSLALAAGTALGAATPMEAVTVSASRRPQSPEQTLASVTVIERAEIEASAAADLLELLEREPGIALARTGGGGQQTSLFLRGGNFNHVLILVDGVRMASSNTGAYAFEHLALEQIERIEIVRGPRAAFYGSDAIGGVIAITTRERDQAGFAARVGSNGRRGIGAGIGARGEFGGFSATVGGEDYDGFSAQTPEGFAYDPDDDGYRNRHGVLRGDLALGKQRLAARVTRSEGDVEFDQGRSAVEQQALALSLEGPLAPGWAHRLVLAHAAEDLSTPVFFAAFRSRREQLDWIGDVALGERRHLVFGLNLQRERGRAIDTFAGATQYRGEVDTRAGFVVWQDGHGVFDYELALRHDDHERYGGEATLQAAGGWRFDGGRVYLSAGEGFRAPNLNELYSPGFGGLFAGNPDLGPERSRSAEIGVEARLGEARGGLNVYRTRIEDLIAFQGGETFRAINIARVEIDGAEATLERSFGEWSLSGTLGWLDARNADSGARLLRRPEWQFGFELGWQTTDTLALGLEAMHIRDRVDIGGALPDYTTLALRGDWRLSADWRLTARLANAGDEQYGHARGFAAAGREFIVGLRWR
jgi:vitamin B12 transporter